MWKALNQKDEIRQEVLDEIKKEGQSIYKDEGLILLHNTELMNKWMKNPKVKGLV